MGILSAIFGGGKPDEKQTDRQEEKEKAAAGLRPAVCRDKKAARRHGQLLLYLDYAYSMM